MIVKKILFVKYRRTHHYDVSFSIFGIPVYRKYERHGVPYIEVLGIRRKISAYNRIRRAIKDVRNHFPNQFDKAIILTAHSGETSLLLAKIADELCEEKNTVLIGTYRYHKKIHEIYTPKVAFYFCPELMSVNMDKEIRGCYEFRGTKVLVPNTWKYFSKFEQEIIHNPIGQIQNFYDRYMATFLPFLGYSKNSKSVMPVISKEVTKSFEKRLDALRLRRAKIAILSPETVSNERLPVVFWQKLSLALHKRGYICVFNVMTMCPETRFGTILPTSFDEAVLLAQRADCVIGLRSGFLDIVAPVVNKMVVLYTNFAKRSEIFPMIDADRVSVAFSMASLPNSPRKLEEIVLKKSNLDDGNINVLIGKILSAI